MKNLFQPGDQKKFSRLITADDQAAFYGSLVHSVCSTFALARDMEWTSRLFFLEMMDEDEEGVGNYLQIDHLSPAFVGEEMQVIATVESIKRNELTCAIEVWVNQRLIAKGRTGQKMLLKEKLKSLFTKPN
jgi:predicted thioesterase